jgi:uncharacterized membrane protein
MNQSRVRRWLLLSLVLNVFLAGGVAGGAVRWWLTERVAGTTAAEPPRGLRYAADELSAEQRRSFRLGLRDARRAAAVPIQGAREGRQEVLRLMREPELDAGAVAQALARTREADMAARARFEISVVDFARTLSQAERQTFASGLARRTAASPADAAASRP